MSAKYRPDIDGLRAIAVSSVVLFHAFPSLIPGGFVGVDIFFVISGYLISSIILSELQTGSFTIGKFYERRVRRIFPALSLVLAFCWCVGYLILYSGEFQTLNQHIVASVFFVENLLLWHESGYFDTSSLSKPLLHIWSLAVEEQYYLFWPLLLMALKKSPRLIFACLCTIMIGSLLYSIYLSMNDVEAAYYSPLSRFWEIMIGSALAYASIYRPGTFSRFGNLQSATGALAIVLALWLINEKSYFPGLWALLPTVGAFLLISAGPDSWFNRHVLSSRILVAIGLISYPLYLWHWPLLSFLHILNPDAAWYYRAVVVGICFVLAAATFLLFEKRFRVAKGKPKSILAPLSLVVAMIVMAGAGYSASAQRLSSRLGTGKLPTDNEWTFVQDNFGNRDANMVGVYRLYPERATQTLFVGDSQVAQYAERLSAIGMQNPEANGAALYIGGGCIPIQGIFTDDVRRKECWSLRDKGLHATSSDEFTSAVIGGSWAWYFTDSQFYVDAGGNRYTLTSPRGRQIAMARLEGQLREISSSGKKAFLLLGNPGSRYFSLDTTKARLFATQNTSGPVAIDKAQMTLRAELTALAARAGAEVIDPFNSLCTAAGCLVQTGDGTPIFKDTSHFNPAWALAHADFIDRTLNVKGSRQ